MPHFMTLWREPLRAYFGKCQRHTSLDPGKNGRAGREDNVGG